MKSKLIKNFIMILVCFFMSYGQYVAQSSEPEAPSNEQNAPTNEPKPQPKANTQSKGYTDTVVLKDGTVMNEVQVEECVKVTKANGQSSQHKKSDVAEIRRAGEGSSASVASNWSDNLGYMSWEEAKVKCESQQMRLPTIAELKTAQDANITNSWKKQGYLYWSTSMSTNDDPELFYAFTGEVYSLSRLSNSYVRCIK